MSGPRVPRPRPPLTANSSDRGWRWSGEFTASPARNLPPPIRQASGHLLVKRPLLIAAGACALLVLALLSLTIWVLTNHPDTGKARIPAPANEPSLAAAQAPLIVPEEKAQETAKENAEAVPPAGEPDAVPRDRKIPETAALPSDDDPFQARKTEETTNVTKLFRIGPVTEPTAPARRACQNFGTAVAFTNNPREAANLARQDHKLLFVLHISGNFEDDKFT